MPRFPREHRPGVTASRLAITLDRDFAHLQVAFQITANAAGVVGLYARASCGNGSLGCLVNVMARD